MQTKHSRIGVAVRVLACAITLALILGSVLAAMASSINAADLDQPDGPDQSDAVYGDATTSSPIALSNDKAFVWSVNPDDDTVSVINTGSDDEVFRIRVGDEPQSVALDPDGEYAYVASAADNSVTVIRITGTSPFAAVVETKFVTGAEPWNIVISPDGKRVFVANSGQDTITVIKADVNFPTLPSIIGNVDLRNSLCNDPDRSRHFQPRGLAVTLDNTRLYVTRFLSFTGGANPKQGTNDGKVGLVCRLNINTASANIADYAPASVITLAARNSGFPPNASELAYPNQLQSIVIRGTKAYLPNIASAPAATTTAPLKFNSDTQAFVSIVDGVTGATSDGGALNLHLGARVPEAGKPRLFFANPWAIAFTTSSGAGNVYVVSAASDLLVKLSVDASGVLTLTNGVSTTRYIDLDDPNNPVTRGRDAGKNPIGIVVRNTGVPSQLKAYVLNYVSRNVSVINLATDDVSKVINLTDLPIPGTIDEQLQVGKEVFFSSRGNFDRPPGTTVSTTNRLSSEGWQSCSSCHFAGLTDGNVWAFGAGPRKSVPLNGTFSPHNPDDQRILNYSAIFDEVEDFELNIRNVSGPGALSTPINGSTFDPNHGLLVTDTGNLNFAPGVVNAFAKANAGRPQHTLTLPGPGSTTAWPALTALKEWVRFGIRTPNGMLTTSELTAGGGNSTGGLNPLDVAQGRRLFFQQGCQSCHGGTKWTVSSKDFVSPPSDFVTENPPVATTVNTQYLPRFLSNINSFNLGVAGAGNPIDGNIGAVEKAADGKDALGKDYNADGKGEGYNVPSLLGIWAVPPYYHNGACETLACVVGNLKHRTANSALPDRLSSAANQARVVAFLQSLDDQTVFPTNLSVRAHDIFFDPPTVFTGATVVVGANVSLFGTKADFDAVSNTLKVKFTGPGLNSEVPLSDFAQNFGQATVTTTWTAPGAFGLARITVQVDSTNVFSEANELDNTASRLIIVRTPPPDTTPPQVLSTAISDDDPFDANDPIASTTAVKIRIVATDPSSPPTTSGLRSFCIVRYYYDTVLRRWVESTCSFQPLPAPDVSSGGIFTYTVNAVLPSFEGAAYAFVWVKDAAGNISRTPGFDVISFIPAGDINIRRNDVRLFRITLTPGQQITFTLPIVFGDVDASVFDNVTPNATRIAVSANNGTLTETVTFANTFGSNRTFQLEVRAVVNSRFRIAQQTTAASSAFAIKPDAIAKDMPPGTPLVAGPPALQTAIGDPETIYLPLVLK